jgi:hypothetical protein
VNEAATIRRDVQIQAGAAADRFVVNLQQLLGRLDPVILFGVIKPAGPN